MKIMEEKDKIINVNVEDILPNRFQPRLAFDENELNELSNSILKYGVIQPIILRQIGEKYEIIAGERRYKATIQAGLKTIPAIIRNTDDNTSAEIALLENLQRKNLTVIEEAQSYRKLMARGFKQDEIANKLENIPLVLDETFVYYDEERLTNILQTLEKIAEEKQIIILTILQELFRKYSAMHKIWHKEKSQKRC